MGLFDQIFRPTKNKEAQKALKEANTYFKTLTAYRPAFTTWHGEIYESLIVRAAIDAIARHVSKLKIEPYGTANPSLQNKLKQGPNQWQTWPAFLYRTASIWLAYNNAVIVPVLNADLETTGIFPVLPTRCEVVEYKDEPWLRYKFSNGERGAVEFKRCAILTRHQLQNDFFGDDNRPLNDTMKLLHIQSQSVEEAVKNTASFKFMAQVSNFLSPEDLTKERTRFVKDNLSSESGAGEFLLFPSTYKDIKQIDVKPYTVNADELKLIYTNVQNYFGVNEKVLQNSLVGDEWAAFYEGAIEPFAIMLSDGLTKALFTEKERSFGSGVIATANRLQYLSNADKLNISVGMADRGIMNRDEVRDIWNLGPLPNGQGKAYTIRGEYYLIDENGNVIQKDNTEEGTDNATENGSGI